MSTAPPNPVDQLHWLREEERHEISWIDHRLQWMLLSQSFLMTAAIASFSSDYPWWCGAVVTFILGCLGTWLTLRGGLAIHAAQAVINSWLRHEQRLCQAHVPVLAPYRLNRPFHRGEPLSRDPLHTVASKLHGRLYPVFAATWIALYVTACAIAWSRLPSSAADGRLFALASSLLLAAAALTFYLAFWRDFAAVRQAATELETHDSASSQP